MEAMKNQISKIDLVIESSELNFLIEREINSLILEDDAKGDAKGEETKTYHTPIYNLFIKPYVSLFKATGIYAWSLVNNARFLFQSITAYDRQDLVDAARRWNKTRQTIDKKWDPLVQAADKTLDAIDPLTKLAILGPNYFLLKGFGKGLAAGGSIHDIFSDTPWKEKMRQWKQIDNLDIDENFGKSQEEMKELAANLERDLNAIFLVRGARMESKRSGEEFLFEQDQISADQQEMTPEETIKNFMQITGLDKELNQVKIEKSEALVQTLTELNKIVKPLQFGADLLVAANFNDFSKVVLRMKSSGAKIDIPLDRISSEIRKNATTLMSEPKFMESPDVKKLKPEQVQSFAENVVFNNSKQSLSQQIKGQISAMIAEIEKLRQDIKLDNETLKYMKIDSVPIVKQAAKFYEDFEMMYKDIKAKLQSQL